MIYQLTHLSRYYLVVISNTLQLSSLPVLVFFLTRHQKKSTIRSSTLKIINKAWMSIPREHFTAVSAHKILARRIRVTILSRHLFPRQQANRRQIFQIPFRPVAILPRERERERRKKGRKIDPHLASSTRKFVLAFLPRNDTAIFGPRNENEETLHFFTPPLPRNFSSCG